MSSVLVIGSGGREHAIAWKLAQSEKVEHIFVAPGNGGTGCLEKVSNVAISEKEHDKIIDFCKEKVSILQVVLYIECLLGCCRT